MRPPALCSLNMGQAERCLDRIQFTYRKPGSCCLMEWDFQTPSRTLPGPKVFL